MLTRKHIRYFLAVADTGQVSGAARALNISQSAVTLAIRDMEGHLGAALFERLPSGLRLTKAGHQFHAHALNIVGAFAAAEQSVQGDAESMTGTVRLGMTWTLSSYFAIPVIERFARHFPDVELQLMEDSRQTVEEALKDGTLDLALVLTSNLSPEAGLTSRTFHRSKRRLWVSVDHPLTRQQAVSLKDVAAYPYALLKSDEAERQGLAHWTAATGQPDIKLASASIEAVRSLVATGQAVAILSDVVYRPWTLEGRRVERVTLSDTIPTMDVGIAWLSERALSPAAEQVRAAFCNPAPDGLHTSG